MLLAFLSREGPLCFFMARAKRDEMEGALSQVECYSHSLEDPVVVLHENVIDLRYDLEKSHVDTTRCYFEAIVLEDERETL